MPWSYGFEASRWTCASVGVWTPAASRERCLIPPLGRDDVVRRESYSSTFDQVWCRNASVRVHEANETTRALDP